MPQLAAGPTGPEVVAHRGASAAAPENTMAAFERAWAGGARWVETDVQPTADGVPVLLHDDTVDRTTDGSGAIRDLTAAAVADLDAGAWFGRDFTGARVPRLTQLLDRLSPERRLLLEIKGEHSPAQIDTLLVQLHASGKDDLVLLQSFEIPALRLVRERQPGRPLGLLVEDWGDDPRAACAALGAAYCNPDHTAVRARPGPVAELSRAGIGVVPWTADDPQDWRFLREVGVAGIITNRPAELAAFLA